ncbi:transcriptional regulator PpsR [Roseinatronobacter bogoriensis subsp. barguzinensis]|nr:transcriptional regulator PpsR [Rhodobaca bogoriensis DSM 18756]TDW38005.1 transcriptional regulator PpsR [Rhodobaca barguzinensis]TDY69825.1 transcriptional regulator PpsR [Rhodobaca bogoriensis DSM 18756]
MTLPDHGGLSGPEEIARFFDDPLTSSVLTSMADICLVLSPEGRVRAVSSRPGSPTSGIVAGWKDKALSELIDSMSSEKLHQRIEQLSSDVASSASAPLRWVELQHVIGQGETLPVRYALHLMHDRRHVLMVGQDQRPTIEMQQMLLNAQIALERDHEVQREIDTRYRLLMDFTNDSIVLVSVGSGLIVDINHNAALMLSRPRGDLLGRSLADFFVDHTRDSLVSALENPAQTGTAAVLEVEIKSSQRRLQMSGKMFRASGEQLAIVRLTDPGEGAIADEQLTSNLRQLFNHGSDAIVFADRDGNILAASETFLNLTDVPSASAVRGRSLADFLARGTVDLRVLLENARRAGQLRMYATRLNTDFGAQVGVEISATWLDDQFDPVLALVLRNSSSAGAVRPDTTGAQDQSMQGVIELVGSSTLKDIVSETTDVIERICIETALELTRNNRVAAAEMLGLSRQSLYVKLRKYDLVSRDEG